MKQANPPSPIRRVSLLALGRLRTLALWLCLPWVMHAAWSAAPLGASPETTPPVHASQGAKPMVLLTMARDSTLFYPAYNDLSDLEGDGVIDFRFKPSFTYVGLFNSTYCYSYSSANQRFEPSGTAGSLMTCSGKWSGNFLNYVTTSRMDALRVALYGGKRSTDGIGNTVLERAYIPQEGHAWAKEYTSYSNDGYYIYDYTPLTQPASGRRHFFGNLTAAQSGSVLSALNEYDYVTTFPPGALSCAKLSDCSDKPPLLRVITNSDQRVWNWASSERPVLNAVAYAGTWFSNPANNGSLIATYGKGTLTDYTVKVLVCTKNYHEGCTPYGSNYKPTGILHDFADSVDFGLLTSSYDQNLSGGRLRKNIESFAKEFTASNGIFVSSPTTMVNQINNIRIRNFNYLNSIAGPSDNSTYYYYSDNYIYRNGLLGYTPTTDSSGIFNNAYGDSTIPNGTFHVMTDGEYGDEGNPIAEMMYEGLRYFAGESKTTDFSTGTTDDVKVGLDSPTWSNPYTTANWCAKPSQIVISSVNPTFDSDQLPGSPSGFASTFSGSLTAKDGTALDVAAIADDIGNSTKEGINGTSRFIGEVQGRETEGAPTVKYIDKLSNARGLPPDDTNKQGSYYAAAVANFGKAHQLNNAKVGSKNTIPTVDTFAVLMNAPIPKIVIPFGKNANGEDKKISIVPFARTIDAPTNVKGSFQPTNRIVGMYIELLTDPENKNGQYHIKFLVNYEDRSWGGDFEMDAIAEYDIQASGGNLIVSVTPTYGASGSTQNIGYVISGTTNDGPYLVVQPANHQTTASSAWYYLNVPAGQSPGYCTGPISGCVDLPHLDSNGNISGSDSRTFTPSGSTVDNYLKDPLWYAAKWGGYLDGAPPTGPTTTDPDNYAQVTSVEKLTAALTKALTAVVDRSSTVGAIGASSSQLLTDTKLFQASFNQKYFTGDLTATTFSVTTGTGSTADTTSYTPAWGTEANGDPKTAASLLLDNIKNNSSSSRNIYYADKDALSLFSTNTTMIINNTNFTNDEVNYLRGDATKEVRNSGNYRNRGTYKVVNGVNTFFPNVLGSIVNSNPAYFNDTKTVYVGANDGMLHAFDANTGVEKFAFIPSAVIPSLNKLNAPTFTHRNYVDGNIAVAADTATGVNYLVGFMGRGAKGLYGLRVTSASPGVDTSQGSVWENYGATDDDMGYLLGQPMIEKLRDSTLVAIFGNGYNSVNGTAVLYVVRVDNGTVLAKFAIPTSTSTNTTSTNNGLATPGITRNTNYRGAVENVYAGDYLGNVWKFDLTGVVAGSTTSTKQYGTKIFTTQTNSKTKITQPITVPITTAYSYDGVGSDVQNKNYIFFGTGSDLTLADAVSTEMQSMYGLIDDGTSSIGKTNLVPININKKTDTYSKFKNTLPVTVRSFSTNTDMKTPNRGWYMDWTTPANSSSEKVFSAATLRSTVPPALVVSSNVLNRYSCDGLGQGYVNAMDAYYGGALTTSFFDINRNHSFADEKLTNGSGSVISSIDFGVGNIGQISFPGNNGVVQGSGARADNKGSSNGDFATQASTKVSRRISWREIVK